MDLDSCKAKVARAQELWNRLVAEVSFSGFDNPDRLIRFSAEYDSAEGQYVCTVAATPESWRLHLGVVAGDVVHNLRSALDHLVWQMVVENYGEPSEKEARKIQFPILEDADKQKWKKNSTVSKVAPAQASALWRFQPFNNDETPHPLSVLQRFSNIDKHRTLNLVYARPMGVAFESPGKLDQYPARLDFQDASNLLEAGEELVRISGLPSGYEREVEQTLSLLPAVFLLLDDETPSDKFDEQVAKQFLLGRLGELIERVEEIVGLFDI